MFFQDFIQSFVKSSFFVVQSNAHRVSHCTDFIGVAAVICVRNGFEGSAVYNEDTVFLDKVSFPCCTVLPCHIENDISGLHDFAGAG